MNYGTGPLSISEATLQLQIINTSPSKGGYGVAILCGWEVLHLRPGASRGGKWGVPISGSLGKGWPDLFLVRRDRIIAAELKSEAGRVDTAQVRILAVLAAAGIETHIWRPSDWDAIVEALR